MSGKAIIDSIERNAARLIGENRRLRGEVERLSASREKLRADNSRLAGEVALLQRRDTIRQLADGFGGEAGGDAKLARARVNRLLREIDKCIGLLNKEA
jgi:hypothetical protein